MNDAPAPTRSQCSLAAILQAIREANGATSRELARRFGVSLKSICLKTRRLRELDLIVSEAKSVDVDGRERRVYFHYAKESAPSSDDMILVDRIAAIWEENPNETAETLAAKFGLSLFRMSEIIEIGRETRRLPSVGEMILARFEVELIKNAKELLTRLPEYVRAERSRITAEGFEPPLLYELNQYRRYLECLALRRAGMRWTPNGPRTTRLERKF